MQIIYKWLFPINIIQKTRFTIEKIMEKPFDIPNIITRNELLYESATPLAQLYNPFVDLHQTHILQEYFIPDKGNNFTDWMMQLKLYFQNNKFKYISLLNITIRYVNKDNITFLKYASCDMYSFVMYYRLEKTDIAKKELKYIHTNLTNISLGLNGTFYLPYMVQYNAEQLKQSFPMIEKFIKLKKNYYDPINIFSSKWFENIKKLK
jgi:hypothetical protein